MSCPRVPESHGDRKKEMLACCVPLLVNICCEPSPANLVGLVCSVTTFTPQARKKKILTALGSCVSSFFQLVNLPTFNSDTVVAQRFRRSQRHCSKKKTREGITLNAMWARYQPLNRKGNACPKYLTALDNVPIKYLLVRVMPVYSLA